MKHDSLGAARRLLWDVEKHQHAGRGCRKDAVLHLRIEGGVMDRIKAEAAARNLSVSDLVRGHLAEHFSEARGTGGLPDFLAATSAFSEVAVMRESPCAVCGEILPRGAPARLAHGPFPAPHLVCAACHDALHRELETRDNPLPGEE